MNTTDDAMTNLPTVIQAADLSLLKTRYACDLSGVLPIDYFRFSGDQVIDAECFSDRGGDEAVRRGDD